MVFFIRSTILYTTGQPGFNQQYRHIWQERIRRAHLFMYQITCRERDIRYFQLQASNMQYNTWSTCIELASIYIQDLRQLDSISACAWSNCFSKASSHPQVTCGSMVQCSLTLTLYNLSMPSSSGVEMPSSDRVGLSSWIR